MAPKTLEYLKRLEEGLTEEDNYTVPGIKVLADMLTTGESLEDYEKRRRTVNTLPSGRKRNILPAYDPVVISRLLIRDHPRFFGQVGHQTTNASIENKQFFH